jgi:DNA polymerase-3 subunit delta
VRLKPAQLRSHLEAPLKPVYLVTGDEPLLIQEAVDEIRSTARQQGFEERQVFHADQKFDWQALLEEAGSLSLFATKKIIELKLPNGKPGVVGSKKLVEFLESAPDDTVLIIESGKIDRNALNSKWCKSLDNKGAIIQVWPIKPEETLGFMRQRAHKLKLNIEHDALQLLSSRLEGNPLAAKQELDKLLLLHGTNPISVGMIFEEVKDSARYDAYDLSKAMLQIRTHDAVNILHHLKAEGAQPLGVLWPLARDVRVIAGLLPLVGQRNRVEAHFKKNRIFPNQQQDYVHAATHTSVNQANRALELLKQADQSIKGGVGALPHWILIEDAVLQICGAKLGI